MFELYADFFFFWCRDLIVKVKALGVFANFVCNGRSMPGAKSTARQYITFLIFEGSI